MQYVTQAWVEKQKEKRIKKDNRLSFKLAFDETVQNEY
jgi:hypothetical protein